MGERAALCTAFPGETAIFTAPKVAPSGKEWICIFIHTKKTNKWAGNMLMFHVDFKMKRLGIRFNESESTLFFERQ